MPCPEHNAPRLWNACGLLVHNRKFVPQSRYPHSLGPHSDDPMPILRLKQCLPILTATALLCAAPSADAQPPAVAQATVTTQNLNPQQQGALDIYRELLEIN